MIQTAPQSTPSVVVEASSPCPGLVVGGLTLVVLVLQWWVFRRQARLMERQGEIMAAQQATLKEQHALACSIRDDGVGFDVEAARRRRGETGLGLCGIQDRLEAVGATFQVTSMPGAGTEVRTTIPLEG